MINILQIETATPMCSVAVSRDGETVSCNEMNRENIHAEMLLPMIDEVLKTADIEMSDLNAICVGKGPGSYTGLRIGVASAKGLSYGLDIPFISLPTLQAFAVHVGVGIQDQAVNLCPMLDARRMEVYTARFNNRGEYLMKESASILNEEFFLTYDKNTRWSFFGSGAEKAESFIVSVPNWNLLSNKWPSAKGMSALAYKAFNGKEFEDMAYFEPLYLKDFIATTPKKNILKT